MLNDVDYLKNMEINPTDGDEEWNCEIDDRGWLDIEDPLPDCEHDAFLPIRVKGRETGNPEWGKYEILMKILHLEG